MALSKTIIAEHAAVASEQPLATMAGYDVLRRGGNAFDAAVATSFALAVTYHPAGGIGGDFFGMFYEAKSGRVRCLNGSGWSPSGLTLDLVLSKAGGRIPDRGPLTCVVPGYVAGVWEMHRELGELDFGGLLRGPVELAEGFPAGEGLCRAVADVYEELPAEARRIFAPAGRTTAPGDMIRQDALAKVLAAVADEGPPGFYSGWPADRIASTLGLLGVPCTHEDFAEFKPEWVTPLRLDYRGTTVHEVPPNSMGATSLLALKMLAEGDLSKAGPLSKDRIERTMKAIVPAYARRDEMLGDPRFGNIDIDAFLSLSRKDSSTGSRMGQGDTTAFSVADSHGNIVSAIQSLFQLFGSRVFVPECGMFLNGRASGFSMAGPNGVEPRKRPLHTLSSLILEKDGRPFLSIGSSGADYRPMLHTLFVTNCVDYSMPAERNVTHPRFLWGGGRSLLVEAGYEDPGGFDVQKLPRLGRTGVCQAIEISEGSLKAVCDPRGDGVPAGY